MVSEHPSRSLLELRLFLVPTGELTFPYARVLAVAGFANGICDYQEIDLYTEFCDLQNAQCDVDVNECDSTPCQNGAVCSESSTDSTVSFHTYKCSCLSGFANGDCAGFFPEWYDEQCTVTESSSNSLWSGNCDVDIDECLSNPCQNGASCNATLLTGVDVETYKCTCLAGFASGVCAYEFLPSYGEHCDLTEDANCDIDVDECSSHPCQNNAACTESGTDTDADEISPHTFRCTCIAGFTNGFCEYDFIPEYSTECTVRESTHNSSWSGICDIDLDECRSNPCQYDGTCRDSNSGLE